MAFACVYVLAQQADPSSTKNMEKERAEAGFRLFWNNINRLLVGYQYVILWEYLYRKTCVLFHIPEFFDFLSTFYFRSCPIITVQCLPALPLPTTSGIPLIYRPEKDFIRGLQVHDKSSTRFRAGLCYALFEGLELIFCNSGVSVKAFL
jgi:hypothetical protein